MCQRSDSIQSRDQANDHWRGSECAEGVCWRSRLKGGISGWEQNSLDLWGLWARTPVLLPHVRGMKRPKSGVQAHMCPNKTQLQASYMWQVKCLKWGVALTSETDHLRVCIECPELSESMSARNEAHQRCWCCNPTVTFIAEIIKSLQLPYRGSPNMQRKSFPWKRYVCLIRL